MKHLLTTIKQLIKPSQPKGQPRNHQLLHTLAPLIKQGQVTISQNPAWQAFDLQWQPIAAHDIAAYTELEASAYNGYLAWKEADFQTDFARNPYCLYLVLVDQDDQMVAGISGRLQARSAHISHVMVVPNFRGYGLGLFMVQEFLAYADYLQISKTELEVRVSNQIALNLYQKLGFKIDHLKKRYYFDNFEDGYAMVRLLPE